MNKIVKLALFAFVGIGLVSCGQKKAETAEANVAAELTAEVDILASADSIIRASGGTLSPKDVYTPEQKELVKKLMTALIENVVVQGDTLHLAISKEEMVAKGIPAIYYEDLLMDVTEMNAYNANDSEMNEGGISEFWAQEIEYIKEDIASL